MAAATPAWRRCPAFQAAAQANQLRYSRGREQEADRVGLNTVVRAGLDPNGMVRMFERMHRAYRFTSKPPEFLLTHPLSETRIADTRSQVQQYGSKRYPRSLDYQMMRNRARLRFADSPEAMVKVFEKELRERPDDEPTQYGLALALSAAEEHDQTIPMMDRILVSNPRNILYSASMGRSVGPRPARAIRPSPWWSGNWPSTRTTRPWPCCTLRR